MAGRIARGDVRLYSFAAPDKKRPVVVLTRSPRSGPGPVRQVGWDGRTVGAWERELDGAAMAVNLAGRSIDCRFTERNRAEVLNSRIEATRALGAAIARAKRPPAVWLNASSLALYDGAPDAELSEETPTTAQDFLAEVCRRWEQTLAEAPTPATRRVALRISLIFGGGAGGVYEKLAGLTRRGLGGPQGDGRQYVSWMHVEDFCRAVEWLETHEEMAGPVNLCAPGAVTNREFMRALRAAWGVRIGLPAARWMLEVGAFFMRTEAELILTSRRGVPGKLRAEGFEFAHPEWAQAIATLVAQDRASRRLQRDGGTA